MNLIYTLKPVDLEILKTYIKIYLKTRFIWPFQSFIDTFIFFDKKSDDLFYLYIYYQSLNNFIIKKQYLLPLISKLLD